MTGRKGSRLLALPALLVFVGAGARLLAQSDNTTNPIPLLPRRRAQTCAIRLQIRRSLAISCRRCQFPAETGRTSLILRRRARRTRATAKILRTHPAARLL